MKKIILLILMSLICVSVLSQCSEMDFSFDIFSPSEKPSGDGSANVNANIENNVRVIYPAKNSIQYSNENVTVEITDLKFGCVNDIWYGIHVSRNDVEITNVLEYNNDYGYFVTEFEETSFNDVYEGSEFGVTVLNGSITFNQSGIYEFYFITDNGVKSPSYICYVYEDGDISGDEVFSMHTGEHSIGYYDDTFYCQSCGEAIDISKASYDCLSGGQYAFNAVWLTCDKCGEIQYGEGPYMIHCYIDGFCHDCGWICNHKAMANEEHYLPDNHPLKGQTIAEGTSLIIDGVCSVCGLPESVINGVSE